MKPLWMSVVEELINDNITITKIIHQVQQDCPGIDAIAIVSVMQYIVDPNINDINWVHRIEMARMNRLARSVTPYKCSSYWDS